MRAAVIDASVATKWVAPEPFSDQAKLLLNGTEMCAPAHWQAEVVNALWSKVHHGEWSASFATERASALMRAPVEAVPLPALIDRALKHSIALRITIYDSLYVALAEMRRIPLVTADGKLLAKMMSDPGLAAIGRSLDDLVVE